MGGNEKDFLFASLLLETTRDTYVSPLLTSTRRTGDLLAPTKKKEHYQIKNLLSILYVRKKRRVKVN